MNKVFELLTPSFEAYKLAIAKDYGKPIKMIKQIIPEKDLPDSIRKEFALNPGDYLEIKQNTKSIDISVIEGVK